MKYLDFYYKALEEGQLPPNNQFDRPWGLCACVYPNDLHSLDLIRPTDKDKDKLFYDGLNVDFWGSGSPGCEKGVFTPLRQTLVLLLAAEAGEL